MLKELRIRNLALVESLDWTLDRGFTAITGETGAGKSVILGALDLVLGGRADKSVIRSGAPQCTVEALFEIADPAVVNARLEEQGVEACEGPGLIIKRVVSASGTNRQFVNCSTTTLAVLKELGDGLVDLHGPHDHQSLFAQDQQLAVLDAYAENGAILKQCAAIWKDLLALEAEKRDLSGTPQNGIQEEELLEHQVREIDQAALTPRDESELPGKYQQAANGQKLAALAAGLRARFEEDEPSILSQLMDAQKQFRELSRLDTTTQSMVDSFASAVLEFEDVLAALSHYSEELDLDPARLAELEERVNLIESLRRKYGSTIEEILAHRDRAAERLAKLRGRAGELARIDAALADGQEALGTAAAGLTLRREKAAGPLAETVRTHLADLGFKRAGFEILLKRLPRPGERGAETVEFQFAPNPGEPSQALRQIASSGEISRVMLALKTALADKDAIPVLVFDEIDANVGGEIAHAVGEKMQALGRMHQVLCITHLPQVAAKAGTHCVVSKVVEDGRTNSILTRLTPESRVPELARMLGGDTPSARALAASMLGK